MVNTHHVSDTVVVSREAQQTWEGICLLILGEPELSCEKLLALWRMKRDKKVMTKT